MKIRRALRIRRTAPWLARLALFALLFQISAVDHHTHPSDITGVVGSSSHEMHCHGAVGSCANGGGEMPTLTSAPALLPLAPASVAFAVASDVATPADVELPVGSEPPRI